MEIDKKKLCKHLTKFVTEERAQLFDKVLAQRTKYFTVVLEDIFQPHNASAVLRTCDCFGVQDVHIIENRNEYNVNPDVSLGSSKWIDLIRYNSEKNNTPDAIKALKKEGYRIIATTPHKNDIDLPDFDISKGKAAFFFGTEMSGLSDLVLDNADEYLKIPMFGFTESFNISVSAAIILNYLTEKLRNSDISWQLTDEEITNTKTKWLKTTIKKSELIIEQFMEKHKLH